MFSSMCICNILSSYKFLFFFIILNHQLKSFLLLNCQSIVLFLESSAFPQGTQIITSALKHCQRYGNQFSVPCLVWVYCDWRQCHVWCQGESSVKYILTGWCHACCWPLQEMLQDRGIFLFRTILLLSDRLGFNELRTLGRPTIRLMKK